MAGVQEANASREAVRHSFPDIELRIHSGRQCPVDKPDRVIEQHFVVTDVDANWREAGQVCAKGEAAGSLGSAPFK